MQQSDKQAYIDRYTERLTKYGYSPKTLGWGQHGRQEVRFGVLAEPILKQAGSSVLDVGCGFADLYDYLTARGWHGQYCGIDIVPALLKVASERHRDLDLQSRDVLDYPLQDRGKFDFVVASGVFNARLREQDNCEHIQRSLMHMFHLAKVAVCVDFLSTHVDFQDPSAWHTDPGWAAELGHRLSGRFEIRHDYMPFEFALIVYRDASRSRRNVFNATEDAQAQSGSKKKSIGEAK